MNKSLQSLKDYGLLSFEREKAVYDVLKYIVDAKIEEEKNKTIITLRKGRKKLEIKISPKSITTTGNSNDFSKELEILEKDCLNEYATSIRAKKELLMKMSVGRFFRFVLVPVLIEAYNNFKIKPEKFIEMLNNYKGEKKLLIFKIRKNITASYKNKEVSIKFNNAIFKLKFVKSKPSINLLNKGFDIIPFQNNTRDAFYAGLPYLLKVINGEDFNYSFSGDLNNLREICKVVLESLYNYLMVENI